MRVILSILILASCSCAHRALNTSGDAYEVRRTALRFMLERWNRSSSASQYSAHVVPPEFVSALGDIRPPAVAHDEKRYPTKGGPAVDTKTGRSVVLWSVSAEKVEGDMATCYVMWYIGILGAGGHTVSLRKTAGIWIAQREEMLWISQSPNKAPEPTPMHGTSAAEQPLVPSTVVAHL